MFTNIFNILLNKGKKENISSSIKQYANDYEEYMDIKEVNL